MRDYAALKAAREMAAEKTREVMKRIAAVLDRDQLTPPIGFKSLDVGPFDGTFVRLRFRPGLGRETWEAVGQWRVMDDGFCGWWDREGNVITPGPLFWAPENGSIQ